MTFPDRPISPLRATARLAWLRQLVRREKLKHSALAHGAGLHSGYVSQIWTGRRKLTDYLWRKILSGLAACQIDHNSPITPPK